MELQRLVRRIFSGLTRQSKGRDENQEINGVSVVDLTAKLLFLVGGSLALAGIA